MIFFYRFRYLSISCYPCTLPPPQYASINFDNFRFPGFCAAPLPSIRFNRFRRFPISWILFSPFPLNTLRSISIIFDFLVSMLPLLPPSIRFDRFRTHHFFAITHIFPRFHAIIQTGHIFPLSRNHAHIFSDFTQSRK